MVELVKHLKGTQDAYNALSGGVYSADTLYFTTEFSGDTELNTGRIYLGGTLVGKPSVWEELPEPPRPKHNEIWYTTTDGQKEDMYDLSAIGAVYTGPELLSNEYKDGKGVMTFAEDVTWLGFDVDDNGGFHYGINFVNASSLELPAPRWETVTLPDTVTELRGCKVPGIGSVGVFSANESLKHVDCGSGTVANGYCAFASCTALSGVSVNLSETVTANCYSHMFADCTSLTTAPELPATALAANCYRYMFIRCTSLTTAPALPATALSDYCYFGMFSFCTSLTTAPELPATELAANCYEVMFQSCTSLNSIEVSFTYWGGETSDWLYNVNPTGTFKCPSALPQTRGDSYIPIGWTIVTK